MDIQKDTPAPASLQFPPIPLVSGDTFLAEDGATKTVAAVTVTIQAEDGSSKAVPLDFRFGGWWAPVAY